MNALSLTHSESFAACRELAKRAGRNFHYTFLTLPRIRYDAMCALYAFMRITDDLGDSDRTADERAADLRRWRAKIETALESTRDGDSRSDTDSDAQPRTAVQDPKVEIEERCLPAIVDTIRRFEIPREYLFEVIRGVEMDLGPVNFATFEDLERYCYLVAGAVGRACLHIWGFHDPRALDLAVDCGLAFQLTNIIRDVAEDARLGRIYLPSDDLIRFDCDPKHAEHGGPSEKWRQLLEFEADRALGHYANSRELFRFVDQSAHAILDAMLGIYGALLGEIQRRRFDVFSGRVEVPRWKKVLIVLKSIARHRVIRSLGRRQIP